MGRANHERKHGIRLDSTAERSRGRYVLPNSGGRRKGATVGQTLPRLASRRVVGMAAMTLVFTSMTGCFNPQAIWWLASGGKDPTVPPQLELLDGKKDRQSLLVITYANSELKFGYDAIDDALCSQVIAEVAQQEERFDLVPERKVRSWKDENPDWADHPILDIGLAFDVRYVLFLEVDDFSLNQTNNTFLYQGHISTRVRVFDVDREVMLLDEMFSAQYPPNRPLQVQEVRSEIEFQNEFLQDAAQQIAWYIVPHEYRSTFARDRH